MSTGADSGGARKRDSARDYTPDQHKAVIRVMKCSHTAYYDILSVEKSSSDGQIKKAYRKLALVMHPDKNAAPQADEAFKRVSKAFQVLSDADKRRIYDQTGGDPDSRAQGFSGFGGGPRGARQAEFDPNDIFNMFFNGGGFPGGGAQFGAGPQVFSFGGTNFQFGGNPFQQRAQRPAQGQETPSWASYVPLVGLLVIMLIVQFFSSDSGTSAASLPRYSFEARHPYVAERRTPNYKFQYFVNPKDVRELSKQKLWRLDRSVETQQINSLRRSCQVEYTRRENALRDAQGWFSRDEEAYEEAVEMPMPSCERLDDLGLTAQYQ